ncbi:MAG: tetratricopeptide repeat protein, partial [Acidimicrobiia bacterium]
GLLRIDDWDVNWQDRYVYRAPIHLQAGTTIGLEFVFDNSTANVRNPIVPAERAGWGWRSIDEMADLWIQVMTQSDRDRQQLAAAVRVKMQTEDAIGGEQVLTREPDHADLRNDVATIYMALGQPEKALAHFLHVTRLRPESAQSYYNEGVALEAVGRPELAAARYREAIARHPTYASAHNNLGALLLRTGLTAEARPHFERAVAADSRNVDARANYATVLIALGATAEAVPQSDAVIAARPSRLRALAPLIVWLAAHPDASKRRLTAARRLAEQLAAIETPPDALVRETLAIALAASGDFRAATTAAEAALRLVPATAPERSSIMERLLLYRGGRTFVLPSKPAPQ